MHREISHTDAAFEPEDHRALFLFTGLIGLLIGLEVVPRLFTWGGLSAFAGWPRGIAGTPFVLIAAVIGGARVLYSALDSLAEGRLGADLALALAVSIGILTQAYLEAALIVFIGLAGECLEAITFARTRRALTRFVEVFPQRCWRLEDGQEVRVLTAQLQVGDKVVVKPGAKIPVDGVVLEGRSAVDTSPLTGESLPHDKGPGEEVLAGSINQIGALTIEAKRVGQQTVAGKVIEMTAAALKDKGKLERTADRLARYFLPVVLGLAALTFVGAMAIHYLGWFRPADAVRLSPRLVMLNSLRPTLAVLVVACPCALILATPAAVIAALGRLAGTGVLIKGGAALERLADVRAFAFDKTGTLTQGQLGLGSVLPLPGHDENELLRLAAIAEQKSEHPIARLIVQAAKDKSLPLEDVTAFRAHPGAGVSVQAGSQSILVGSRRLLEEQGLPLPPEIEPLLERLDQEGQSLLLVAVDGQVLGVIGARDQVRPEAAGVLEDLSALGISPIVLLTGDRAAVARSLDLPALTETQADLLPQDKAAFIDKLKETSAASPKPQPGRAPWTTFLTDPEGDRPRVAMVGDGINDAPALARADVGLAIGSTGSDIAAEAGDILLMGEPLRSLPLLVRLARQTKHIIRQNILYFAFIVNIVGVVLVAWLWPLFAPPNWEEQSPLAAVIYHQIGSIAVLFNSMRLLWFERGPSSPWIIRLKSRGRDIDRWMEKNLDFGSFLHWAEHHYRGLLAGLGFLLLIVWGFTGLKVIGPDEKAVVRRFGAPVADLEPGWHVRLPWPIEDVARVSQKVQTVEVGFRSKAGELTWTSEHRRDNRLLEESLLITGDRSLVDVQISLRYHVTGPRTYLFEVRDVTDLLRTLCEAEMRQLVAGRPFEALLTRKRSDFEALLTRRVEKRVQEMGGLGVAIDGLSVLDLHPPGEVVADFYEVIKAMERRDKTVNEARRDAIDREKTAEAEAKHVKAMADAYRVEKIEEAQALESTFTTLSKARRGNPELSDFRRWWDMIGPALKGREYYLLDVEPGKVPVHRSLWFLEPDPLRGPRWVPGWPAKEP